MATGHFQKKIACQCTDVLSATYVGQVTAEFFSKQAAGIESVWPDSLWLALTTKYIMISKASYSATTNLLESSLSSLMMF